MLCIVCGNTCDRDDLADGEAFLCGECCEDMGIDVEEWEVEVESFAPMSPQEQIDAMADLLRKKNRGEL